MITLFRKIRQKLLASGSFPKYLLYAIGEILLVVIGILIALQVNNWNEERKNRDAAESILIGVKSDLLNDIREAEQMISRISTISDQIHDFTNGLEEDNSSENLYRLGFQWQNFVLNKGSYSSLVAMKDKIPENYLKVAEGLDEFYSRSDRTIELRQDQVEQHILAYKQVLADEKEWYVEFAGGNYSSEVREYMNNSLSHRNKVTLYASLIEQVSVQLLQIRNRARFYYLLLHNMLTPDEPYSPYIELPDLEIDDEKSKGLTGTYSTQLFDITIEKVNRIHIIYFDGRSLINMEPFLIKDLPGDTLGAIIDNDLLIINRDENNRITNLTIVQEEGSVDLYKQ